MNGNQVLNGGVKISKEDWLKQKPEDRDRMLYDCIQAMGTKLDRMWKILIGLAIWIVIGKEIIPLNIIIAKAIAAIFK